MAEITIRNFRWDDLDDVVSVWGAAAKAAGNPQTYTREQLRMFLEMPDARVDSEVFVVEADGKIIGYAADEFDPSDGQGFGECAVHPDYQNQGIGTRLLRMTDDRIAALAEAEAKPDMPLDILRVAVPGDQYAIRIFQDEGYEQIRAFYVMEIDLNAPVDAESLPEGFILRPVDREHDLRAVYEAHQEAFHDHWNHTTDAPYEEWLKSTADHPDGDVGLWLAAWDGDHIAGVAISRGYSSEEPDHAWVSTLAVRRDWRRRGLGFALLRQSFALLQSRGYKRASLSVDGASLTNAVALYERAGMRLNFQRMVFRKRLRDAVADSNA